MTPARIALLLAATALLSTAAASEPPAVAFKEAHYTGHDVAVLTAAFVARHDDATDTSDVQFACTATQPALGTRLVCTVYYAGGSTPFSDASPVTTGAIAASGSFRGDDDAIRVCASLAGSSVPPACAVPT